MSKLFILAERDTLEFLNSKGVYPDSFYTDFDKFVASSVYFTETDVVILVTGLCYFNEMRLCDLYSKLSGRVGAGLNSVVLLSDIELNTSEYYKYTGTVFSAKLVKDKSTGKKSYDIWAGKGLDKTVACASIGISDSVWDDMADRLGMLLREGKPKEIIIPIVST